MKIYCLQRGEYVCVVGGFYYYYCLTTTIVVTIIVVTIIAAKITIIMTIVVTINVILGVSLGVTLVVKENILIIVVKKKTSMYAELVSNSAFLILSMKFSIANLSNIEARGILPFHACFYILGSLNYE